MAYCPTCKREFEDDLKECPTDKVPLVDELPFQTIEGEGGAWVEIASVVTQNEARILQGFLEAEGIPAQIESLKFTMEPVNLGALAEIRVYVHASREEEAAQLLEKRSTEFDESASADDSSASAEEESDSESN